MLFLHWQPQFLDLEELRPGGLPGVDVIPPLTFTVTSLLASGFYTAGCLMELRVFLH
jgi:hypothetical protein